MGRANAVLAIILSLCLSVEAATYYVSTSGDDSNNGLSLSAPFLTVDRCASLANNGDVCSIRSGTYRETVDVTDNGVTFTGYNGEIVTISGADKVPKGVWTVHSGKIYKTKISLNMQTRSSDARWVSDNSLYVDGRIMPPARWPNIDYNNYIKSNFSEAYSLTADGTKATSTYTATVVDPLLSSAINFNMANSVKCTATWASMYYTGTCPVTSGGSGRTSFSINCAGRDGFASLDLTRSDQAPRSMNFYYLYDNLNLLDTPGEWFYDKSTSYLYAYMPDGGSPDNHNVEFWARNYTFNFHGKQNVKLSGINTFAGLINTFGSSAITIQNCDLRYLWHMTDLVGFNRILNNGFSIVLDGDRNTFTNNTVGPTATIAITLGGTATRTVILNNVIYGCSYAPYFKCVQIVKNAVASGSTLNSIVQNTGFYSGDVFTTMDGGVNMYYNDFYQSNLQRCDFGVIYTYNQVGRGAEIAYNYIHDAYAPVKISKYGIVNGYSGASGIYIDNGGTNVKIYRNVVWGTSSAGLHIMGQYNGNAGYPSTPVTENITFAYNTVIGFATGSSTQQYKKSLFKNNMITQGWKGTLPAGVFFVNNPTGGDLDDNYCPASGSELLSSAQKMWSPYDNKVPTSLVPAVGAKDPNMADFLPGAYVRTIDISSLRIGCDSVTNGKATCRIYSIPIGRKLPLSFVMGVGPSPSAYASCSTTMYYDSGYASGLCLNVPVTKSGPLFVRLYGTTAWLATSASVTA